MRNITRASIALIGAVALTGATALSASAEPISDGGAPVTVAVDGGEIVLGAPSALALTAAAPKAIKPKRGRKAAPEAATDEGGDESSNED